MTSKVECTALNLQGLPSASIDSNQTGSSNAKTALVVFAIGVGLFVAFRIWESHIETTAIKPSLN